MIRLRIPPSPTGLLHIGTARTALYNYLFAKKHGGTLVLRMEDTDRERSKKEYEVNIVEGLKKLGIAGDEGVHVGGPHAPYRQSERTEIYTKYLKQLADEGKVYYCFCDKERLEEMHREQMAQKLPPRYDGTCRDLNKKPAEGEKAVIRLRVPDDQNVTWNDLVRGDVTIHSGELDDIIIARAIDDPLYNFTVVIDDHDMAITHVIRGEDHISNTPKQILIFQAFGWELPRFAHLPLILNEDKSKLSKRKNKVSVDDYLTEGILTEALLNYLALLGWNTPDKQELFTLPELVEKFSLEAVHKGGAVFDMKRLEWMNGEWIKRLIEKDAEQFYKNYKNFIKKEDPKVIKLLADPDLAGRFRRMTEIPEALAPFFALPDYNKALLLNEKFKVTPEIAKQVLRAASEVVSQLNWETGDTAQFQQLSDAMVSLAEKEGLKNGQVLWPLRVALSGMERSPNFATFMVHLGKEEVVKRLAFALKKV